MFSIRTAALGGSFTETEMEMAGSQEYLETKN
jgi:hypothetical protein